MGALVVIAAAAALLLVASRSNASGAKPVDPTPPPLPYLEVRSGPIVGIATTAPQTQWSVGRLNSSGNADIIDQSTATSVINATASMLGAFAEQSVGQPAHGIARTDRGEVTFIVSRSMDGSWVWTTSEGLVGEGGQSRGLALRAAVSAAMKGPQ